jgi:hypothetical protein
VIHNQRIKASPAIDGALDGLGSETRVRHVAGEDFDLFGAVLVVQLVERGVRAGDEDEFVRVREQVVRGC